MTSDAAARAIAEARALLQAKRSLLCSHGVMRETCKGHDLEKPKPAEESA